MAALPRVVLRSTPEHRYVRDIWDPETRLYRCLCFDCRQEWTEGASVEEGYPLECKPNDAKPHSE